jgi:hypothetical protein
MPEISLAKTIVVVTLPPAARDAIGAGDLGHRPDDDEVKDRIERGLDPQHFDDGPPQTAMTRVVDLVGALTPHQKHLLLDGLQHAVSDGDDDGHRAAVHFLELESAYKIDGVGLEIRDDTVTEEKLCAPLRVMFVNWHS